MTRHAARVILLDGGSRILFLRAKVEGKQFWLMPGGGIEPGEDPRAAARREVLEETGLNVSIGAHVWTRRHVYTIAERIHDQTEQYFVARTDSTEINPLKPDDYIFGHQWWTLEEIVSVPDDFTPRRIRELLPPILAGEYPTAPFDCGV